MSARFRERTAWLGRHVFPHEPALRSWLYRRKVDGLETDDIIQETYTRLVALDSVDHIDNPKTYAFQIAFSLVVDHLRRSKVIPLGVAADLDALGAISEDPSPERSAIDRDELRYLATALAALPARIGEVFRLRRVEGLAQREVAKRMGITESTVEKHMARGAQLLTESLRAGGCAEPEPSKSGNRRSRRAYVKGDSSTD
jgi:RNA polymerase sigma factor (sigma-70 family)